MTDKEILTKAIEKASKNGCGFSAQYEERLASGEDFDTETVFRVLCFRHDFAKAFFGDGGEMTWVATNTIDYICIDCGHTKKNCKIGHPPKEFKDGFHKGCKKGEVWKVYLQQMVLEEEPLKYLEQFL